MNKIHVIGTNKQGFVAAFAALLALKTAFLKKDILLCDANINKFNNNIFLFLKLFFRYRKIKIYEIKKIGFLNKIKKTNDNIALLLQNLQNKKNITSCFILNLNKKIKTFIVCHFLKTFKRFKHNLFIRRNDLFSDFLNLSTLLIAKKIRINSYILILGQIFTVLLKHKHSSFFFFKNFI